MTHFQVTIQIPLEYNLNDGELKRKSIEPEKFKQTQDELLKDYHGVNTSNVPIHGAWINPTTKQIFLDKNVAYNAVIELIKKGLKNR